ncbi:hypothetical protein H4582DRAFT_777318 [Lactarius indigo]|nr:hypothetical protein H4582DRAFT_777318 [Lactarius indigo]
MLHSELVRPQTYNHGLVAHTSGPGHPYLTTGDVSAASGTAQDTASPQRPRNWLTGCKSTVASPCGSWPRVGTNGIGSQPLSMTAGTNPHAHTYIGHPIHSRIQVPPPKLQFSPIIMALPSSYVLEPAKQVERSDRQLQQAQALYEGYRAKMNPFDRILVQSLLAYSGDLRYGFEDKYLLTRVRQARLYCNRVGETLRMIQMAVEKAIDTRALAPSFACCI